MGPTSKARVRRRERVSPKPKNQTSTMILSVESVQNVEFETKNVESKIAFLLHEVSYSEPYLVSFNTIFTRRPAGSSCYLAY